MPKRIVHGERVWRSTKLSEVNPEFRAEFANLLPLALANGTFECDPMLIWTQVYAFNRPSVRASKVIKILDEFERVRMLFRWNGVGGKPWGFWIGIRNGNVLPKISEVGRGDYRIGEEPPAGLLASFLSFEIDSGLDPASEPPLSRGKGLGSGLGTGIGSGIGLDGREESMNVKSEITIAARRILDAHISPNDRSWPEITGLCGIHGCTEMIIVFREWATKSATQVISDPLVEFIRAADGLLDSSLNAGIGKVTTEMTSISGGTVIPDDAQSLTLGRWLKKYTPADIIEAFRLFYRQIEHDDSQVRLAARTFFENGVPWIEQQKQIALQEMAEAMFPDG